MRINLTRPHPWHGIATGLDVPRRVTAYIEITPLSTVKYEVDKETGYLAVDRPQRSASLPPCAYGFLPRTYCGPRVAKLADAEVGDGDPLDVCVLAERVLDRSDVLMRVRPVGGVRMVDKGEADDKIICVLEGDAVWGEVTDISGLPKAWVERVEHYFSTYKLRPGENAVKLDGKYGFEGACAVIEASILDYQEKFGTLHF